MGRLAGFATTSPETKELLLIIGLVVKRETGFLLVAIPAAARAEALRSAASGEHAVYELKWVKNAHLPSQWAPHGATPSSSRQPSCRA